MTSVAGPALQCPECKHKHPVDEIPGGTRLFRCRTCSRVLKVPAALLAVRGEAGPPAGPGSSGAPGVPDASGEPTMAVPASGVEGQRAMRVPGGSTSARPSRRVRPQRGPRPAFRAFVWMLALPVGLGLAAGPLVAAGFLDVDRLLDVLSGEGFERAKLPLVLIPSWAAVAATLAHVAIEWRARALIGRARPDAADALAPSVPSGGPPAGA